MLLEKHLKFSSINLLSFKLHKQIAELTLNVTAAQSQRKLKFFFTPWPLFSLCIKWSNKGLCSRSCSRKSEPVIYPKTDTIRGLRFQTESNSSRLSVQPRLRAVIPRLIMKLSFDMSKHGPDDVLCTMQHRFVWFIKIYMILMNKTQRACTKPKLHRLLGVDLFILCTAHHSSSSEQPPINVWLGKKKKKNPRWVIVSLLLHNHRDPEETLIWPLAKRAHRYDRTTSSTPAPLIYINKRSINWQ